MLETIIILLTIGLDQLAKYLTDVYLMPLGTTVPLWEGVLHLTSVHNTGAAFGMLSNGTWLLSIVSFIASLAIIWALVKYKKHIHTLMRISLALILAGALGNLIDRVALGYVRDMLEFAFVNFAIFNVADAAVTVGAVLLALDVLFGKGRQVLDKLDEKPGKKNPAPEAGPEQGAAEPEEPDEPDGSEEERR
ncbi:MAG TPA: signal peptidase II [Feifaniaceae bacterium]|nr:signal peptidase II [Feifaniaceae bacterium]